jgi:geranylgeranyl reductase family protein
LTAVYVQRADALVIGAGPAGSAAARVFASAGARVVLADRHVFPRDKVCGDALIPDALQALADLGLLERVLAVSRRVHRLRVYAPDDRFLTLEGDCACAPRRVLDEVLRAAAVEAGAVFQPRLRAIAAIEENGMVRGAEFEDVGTSARVSITAPVTVIATGAASDVLDRFGVCTRRQPSATAARVYVRVEEAYAAAWDHLCIAYSAAICPGYGWIFPGPDAVFNVGVGYFYDAANLPRERNVRRLLAAFLDRFPPAVELMRRGTILGALKGAPLRTAMEGARFSRPGLFVAGESAGLTYSFSGEGIGKALQSGILAAGIALRHDDTFDALRTAAAEYERTLIADFGRRFAAYRKMQRWLAYPAFANFLARRGSPGSFVQRQLQSLFDETGDPHELLSLRGILRALFT